MSNGLIGPSLGVMCNRFLADHERNEYYTVSPKQPVSCTPHHTVPGFLASLNKFNELGVVGHNV
jgi:hypothetical protein